MCYHRVVTERNSRIYPTSTVADRFARSDLNPVNYSVWGLLQEKVYKTRVTELDELKQRLRTYCSGPIRHWLCRHFGSHSSVASLIAPEQWRVFVHHLLQHMLLSAAFKSDEFGGHSWGGINYGVAFCNNSKALVACAQWAFQVSQGSAETLFRWNGKRLHHFEANVFRKRCTKFYQNRPSSIEDITKKVLVSFFLRYSAQGGPKMAPFLYALTLPNVNGFSKLFHYPNQDKICNNTVTKDPITPQVCR